MTLGERIRKVRKENKLNQAEFGKRLTVSGSYISMVESDKENPSDIFLKLLALEFNISTDWLIYEKGEEKITAETSDFFGRNDNTGYYNDIKDSIDFLAKEIPVTSTIDLSAILGELVHLYKIENISDSKKVMILQIIASYVISIIEIVDKSLAVNKEDPKDIVRFSNSINSYLNDFQSSLNDLKKILI